MRDSVICYVICTHLVLLTSSQIVKSYTKICYTANLLYTIFGKIDIDITIVN